MHAVIRSYSGKGSKELTSVLERDKGEIEKLIRAIKGFVFPGSYAGWRIFGLSFPGQDRCR